MSGFLVLTRHEGQSIIVGGNIKITFMGYRRGEARIGICAPKDITVHREEVHDRIQAEKDPQSTPYYAGVYDAKEPL